MMNSLPPFGQPGQWLKGNLHTHTTQSDGKLTPAENVKWHAEHGYHFATITDHNRVTDPRRWVPAAPIPVISSVEVTARRGEVEYHILSLGVDDMPAPRNSDPQVVIDAVNAAGGVAIVAHPYWHDLTFDDLLALHGHIAIEIFNTGCQFDSSKALSVVHWDGVLRRGQRVFGVATDDSHFAYPDYGGGWIWLRAEQADRASIVAALRAGAFYASTGPEIHDVQLDGRQVTVHCSPAFSILVIGDYYHCPMGVHAWDGNLLTEATFTLDPEQEYLRVEVIDVDHHSAWTNAHFVEAHA